MLSVTGTLDSAQAASPSNLIGTYSNGTLGVGATLTSTVMTALVVDGYAASVGDRILLISQLDTTQNGVYVVTNAGSVSANWVLTRASDFDNSTPGEVKVGIFIFVVHGTVNCGSSWLETGIGTGVGGAIIIGTDPILFTESNSVLYTFLPGANVFVVQAATFGIAKGLVTSVSMAQSTPLVTTVTYAITYNNPARTPAPVDSSLVFATLDAAVAYYVTVIT